jgi:hypothetical protein
VLDERDIEIEEQAQPAARQTKVGEHLEFMDGFQPLHRLQLDDDQILDEQIETKANVEGDALVIGNGTSCLTSRPLSCSS